MYDQNLQRGPQVAADDRVHVQEERVREEPRAPHEAPDLREPQRPERAVRRVLAVRPLGPVLAQQREVLDDYILRNAKVVVQGTRGSSKFYDDKSNWTGVAKKGGPSTNDPKLSLATMTNTGR